MARVQVNQQGRVTVLVAGTEEMVVLPGVQEPLTDSYAILEARLLRDPCVRNGVGSLKDTTHDAIQCWNVSQLVVVVLPESVLPPSKTRQGVCAHKPPDHATIRVLTLTIVVRAARRAKKH